ncbi:MAG TPA: DUF1460 domain-containing protein [Deltaproteobacteria bacterium]|nr:DUF1460 domain-containing protein [Deltaproteobacteria bacterium]
MGSNETIRLGTWSRESISELLASLGDGSVGSKIGVISGAFLGTPYEQATLMGSAEIEECVVVNLAGLDCFTFLDYVEAMRRSNSFDEFVCRVKEVRYRSGVVSYRTRNHFFTDWIEQNGAYVTDVTGDIGGNDVRTVRKHLNRRHDGTAYVPDITPFDRDVTYLPINALFGAVHRLQIGDYLGVYSPFEGLDVSHTGIVVEVQGGLALRHASSREGARRVVDQDLMNYLVDKPGMIILRPHEAAPLLPL